MPNKILQKLSKLFRLLEKTELPCSCLQCGRLLDLREKHLLLMHTMISHFAYTFGQLDDDDLRLIFYCGEPEEPEKVASHTLH